MTTPRCKCPAFLSAALPARRYACRTGANGSAPGITAAQPSYQKGKALHEARLFHDADLVPGTLCRLSKSECNHVRARRIAVGAHVKVFNNRGELAAGLLESEEEVLILNSMPQAQTSVQTIHAAVALVKSASRADWIVEKLTELGVGSISFVRTARVVGQGEPSDNRIRRWNNVCIAAAKQSLRDSVPVVGYFTSVAEMVAAGSTCDLVLVLSAGGDALLSEECMQSVRGAKQVMIVVGPEGGLTAEEEEMVVKGGARRIGLGASRLRVETAVVTCVGVVAQIGLTCR